MKGLVQIGRRAGRPRLLANAGLIMRRDKDHRNAAALNSLLDLADINAYLAKL